MQQALRTDKAKLRKSIGSLLKSLSDSDIQAQSQAIVERVLESAFFKNSRSIACYLSMPVGEVNTSRLVTAALASDKHLFAPRVDRTIEGHMDFLRVYGESDLASLPAGLWGIRQPDLSYNGERRVNAVDLDCSVLDTIIVPGVAFDRQLSRLGHGKGYYDRFFTSYTSALNEGASSSPRPLLVALALREQVLETGQIPMGEYDWKVDMIITPDEIIQT